MSEAARTIRTIAVEIAQTWGEKVNFAAKPYLDAMLEDDGSGMYYYDTMDSVVLYFLSNASTWRGDDARRIKAELKAIIK
jgi:hypothetical protein